MRLEKHCKGFIEISNWHFDIRFQVKLIDLLLQAEKVAKFTKPVNCYRKYLGMDILDVVNIYLQDISFVFQERIFYITLQRTSKVAWKDDVLRLLGPLKFVRRHQWNRNVSESALEDGQTRTR